MVVTDEMLQNAVKKAIELGLLPRKSQVEDIATNNELMLQILQAALSVYPEAAQVLGIRDNYSMRSTRNNWQGP